MISTKIRQSRWSGSSWVSILYLPRLWFLPIDLYGYWAKGSLSQSSIYRGYDFYASTVRSNVEALASLNPLSTEVMISTSRSSGQYLIQPTSQSSIYRGYDFYAKKLWPSSKRLKVSILYLPRLWFLPIWKDSVRYVETQVSILYLPRLWFLHKTVCRAAYRAITSQSSIYRGYDFYWFLFLHPPSCGSRVNCANQTWVR